MRTITVSDITMKQTGREGITLSFREKLELCKLLDRLGVSAIETPRLERSRTDGLLLKSLSTAIGTAELTVSVPVNDPEGIGYLWSCLGEARHPRLQVELPVSTVQMEYLYHKKPEAMLALIRQTVAACKRCCPQVEFTAEDAGRSDPAFLIAAMRQAIEAGAVVVTYCDTAGNRLPEELYLAVRELREALGDEARLGVRLSNQVYLANSCAVSAIKAGADEVKVSAVGDETVSLQKFSAVLQARGEDLGVSCGIRMTELSRGVQQIERLCKTARSKSSPFDQGVREEETFFLSVHDDLAAVLKAAQQLGYELSPEDGEKVYEAFAQVAGKKEQVSARELDALIAASALQVPPTYVLDSFVINSGNQITSTSHVRLRRGDRVESGVCVGDGPIDASFLAIEQIVGTHYELDDFQIRAVTEGREAMGEAIVRLRHQGKLYSGRGISTDIVGSSIRAYINALNKIVYEETA